MVSLQLDAILKTVGIGFTIQHYLNERPVCAYGLRTEESFESILILFRLVGIDGSRISSFRSQVNKTHCGTIHRCYLITLKNDSHPCRAVAEYQRRVIDAHFIFSRDEVAGGKVIRYALVFLHHHFRHRCTVRMPCRDSHSRGIPIERVGVIAQRGFSRVCGSAHKVFLHLVAHLHGHRIYVIPITIHGSAGIKSSRLQAGSVNH